jgi:hypothetical protein
MTLCLPHRHGAGWSLGFLHPTSIPGDSAKFNNPVSFEVRGPLLYPPTNTHAV